MSATRVALQPGWLLHSRHYRNTSLIIDVFSRDHGRISLVARGARQAKSRWPGLLQPFQRILFSWQGRGDLKTLTAAEYQGLRYWLQGTDLLSGLYANELLVRLLQRDDPHAGLYVSYEQLLCGLGEPHEVRDESKAVTTVSRVERRLRQFERQLLTELGYGLVLDHDVSNNLPISAQATYRYTLDHGPVQYHGSASASPELVSGQALLALVQDVWPSAATMQQAKQLMRLAIKHHLAGRPLHSRRLFQRSR